MSDYGKRDFTIEGWLPGMTVDGWTHIPIERDASQAKTLTHTSEMFEGVLFVSCRIYDADGRLESVSLTRADLVRGYISEAEATPFAKYDVNFTPPTAPFPESDSARSLESESPKDAAD